MKKGIRTRAQKKLRLVNSPEREFEEQAVELLDSAISGLSMVIHSPVNKNSEHPSIRPHDNPETLIMSQQPSVSNIETTMSSDAIIRTLNELKDHQERQNERFRQFEQEMLRRVDVRLSQDGNQIYEAFTTFRRETREDVLKFRSELNDLSTALNANVNARQAVVSESHQVAREEQPNSRETNQPTEIPRQIENSNNLPLDYIQIPSTIIRPYGVKPQLPKFEALTNDRPIKFLRELEDFLKMPRTPDSEIHTAIRQALKGTANEWWYVMAPEIHTWEQFARIFTSRFWSESIQRKVRSNLESGYYRESSELSRVAYATRLIGNARDLTPPNDDEKIVKLVSRHFSQAILDAVTAQNITTVEAFIMLLERWDNGGSVNRAMARFSGSNNRDDNNQQRPAFTPRSQNRAQTPTTIERSPYPKESSTPRDIQKPRTSFSRETPTNRDTGNHASGKPRVRVVQMIEEEDEDPNDDPMKSSDVDEPESEN